MKRFVTSISVILVLVFALSNIGLSENNTKEKKEEGIQWMSLDKAIPLAKKENKHVFIDFSTSWCGYCKKMDKEVFTQQSVIDLLNNDFIPVRVNGEGKELLEIDGYKITERELTTREFGVRGYPTFWFLTPDGKKLTNFSGYRPADYMSAALTFIKDYKYDSTKTKNETPAKDSEKSN